VNKIMLLPLLFKTYLVLEFIWSWLFEPLYPT
jgi:hypothetical protein